MSIQSPNPSILQSFNPPLPQSLNPPISLGHAVRRSHSPRAPSHLGQQAPLVFHSPRHHRLRRVPGGGRGHHPGDERLRQGEHHRGGDRHQFVPGPAGPHRPGAADRRPDPGHSQAAAHHPAGRGGREPGPARGPGRGIPVRLAHPDERRGLPEPYGRRRIGVRHHPTLPDRPGLPLRRRRTPGRARRERAAPHRRAWVGRGREAVRQQPGPGHRQADPGRGSGGGGKGGDRQEGQGPGTVLRRVRPPALLDLRGHVRPAQDHRRVGEDGKRR